MIDPASSLGPPSEFAVWPLGARTEATRVTAFHGWELARIELPQPLARPEVSRFRTRLMVYLTTAVEFVTAIEVLSAPGVPGSSSEPGTLWVAVHKTWDTAATWVRAGGGQAAERGYWPPSAGPALAAVLSDCLRGLGGDGCDREPPAPRPGLPPPRRDVPKKS
jgi:hypothetical protein